MIAYKFLLPGAVGPFSEFSWPTPAGDEPGAWVQADDGGGGTSVCRSGIHACRTADLPYWLGAEAWEVELAGDVVEHRSKVVAPRGRLLRRLWAWDPETRLAYTEMCADRARAVIATRPDLEPWAAVIEPSMREGPALLGFIAARIAETADGPTGYDRERAHQSAWLVERLRLTA